jgi:hypothetical protein
VSAFESKVCGYKYFRSARRPQDSAVVADSEGNGFAVAAGKISANLLDQGKFAHRLK